MTGTALVRRPQEATTWPELEQYFSTRARQLWHEGWRWSQSLDDVGVGCRTEFTSAAGEQFASYYVLAQYHGQGHFKRLVSADPLPIVTITDCHIEQILHHIGARYVRAGDLLDSAEYRLVEVVLADNRNEAGVFLMNHVDDGLAVLADRGTDALTKRAFCLLPLVSEDSALAKYHDSLVQALTPIPEGVESLALAVSARKLVGSLRPDRVCAERGVPSSGVKAVDDLLVAETVLQLNALSRSKLEDATKHEIDGWYLQSLGALGAADRYSWFKSRLPSF
jgi:hypothetical protein